MIIALSVFIISCLMVLRILWLERSYKYERLKEAYKQQIMWRYYEMLIMKSTNNLTITYANHVNYVNRKYKYFILNDSYDL